MELKIPIALFFLLTITVAIVHGKPHAKPNEEELQEKLDMDSPKLDMTEVLGIIKRSANNCCPPFLCILQGVCPPGVPCC